MEPRIDLEFYASPFYFKSLEEEFVFWIKIKLHNHEPITLNTSGTILDPEAIFAQGLVQITEAHTGSLVTLQRNAHEENREHRLAIDPQRGSFLVCWSSIPGRGDREKYPFDAFQPASNTRYILQYKAHGFKDWYPVSLRTSAASPSPSKPLAVDIKGPQAFTFLAQDGLPPQPPLKTTISTSQPTCSLSGQPPFTISVLWALTTQRSIIALRTVDRGRPMDIEIRDLQRNSRRIGLLSSWVGEDVDPPEQTELVRIGPDGSFLQTYTLSKEAKAGGLRGSDMQGFVTGNKYSINMRSVRWRWRFEDEIDEDIRKDESRLKAWMMEWPAKEFRPEGKAEFAVVD